MKRQKIKNLNLISDYDLEYIKSEVAGMDPSMGNYEAKTFLESITDSNHRRKITSFLNDVVLGDIKPKDWKNFNCRIIPFPSLEVMLTKQVNQWGINGCNNERLIQIKPKYETWFNNQSSYALAEYNEELDYLTVIEKGSLKYYVSDPIYVDDAILADKRYCAMRIAKCLRDSEGKIKGESITEILEVSGFKSLEGSLSEDAKKIINCLIEEIKTEKGNNEYIPGFSNDDVWRRLKTTKKID
ncbi:MAG: hypothetical protein HRU38_20380 [Saccharospirillaceae bacterium]|nr:hypothetical protein [Pseudomonadales bacterium]NRB80991.1 hypothetical protein [Saccharospirillaceae bacterium]